MQLFKKYHQWGIELTGFGRPFGIGIDGDNAIMITDMDCHVVIKIDSNFHSSTCWNGIDGWTPLEKIDDGFTEKRPKNPPIGLNGPHSVAIGFGRRLIVCCYYQPSIVECLDDGSCKYLIGGDILTGPASAMIDHKERLLVAEYAQNLIHAFDLTCTYLGSIGLSSTNENLCFDACLGSSLPSSKLIGGFDRPHMAITLGDGSLLVADTWNNRVQKFSPQGFPLGCYGDGREISCPVALSSDSMGRVLVTSWGDNNLVLFTCENQSKTLDLGTKLNNPYDARFYRDGIVVADSHNGRVLICNDLLSFK